MVPDKFNMVDMEGIDIITSQGEEIPGLYQKLVESIAQCRYQCIYNWKFDGILIPPTYVEMTIIDDVVWINEGVSVDEEDVIRIYSLEPPAPEPRLLALAVSANGDYLPPADYDGFSSVNVSVPEPAFDLLQVTANGTYYPPQGVDGFRAVEVNVPTGSAQVNESLLRNWDFTNPVNTRGRSVYTNETAINAWKGTSPTTCTVVQGGIKVSQTGTGDRANLYNSFKIAADNLFVGKVMTLSIVVDDILYTTTITGTTSGVQEEIEIDGGYANGGMTFWFNRDGSARYAIGFYVTTSSPDYLIKAVKLEYGSAQTLASVSGGVATLLSHQDIDVETFLGSSSNVSVNW